MLRNLTSLCEFDAGLTFTDSKLTAKVAVKTTEQARTFAQILDSTLGIALWYIL
jgi:hypothetical protein